MIDIKRFDSFADAKRTWQKLENTSQHYPFQSWWYNNLFTKHFSDGKNIYILGIYTNTTPLAIGAFEIVAGKITFLGTKDVSQTPGLVQDITDFGDLLYTEQAKPQASAIWHAIVSYFTKQNLLLYSLLYVRQDSPTFEALQSKGKVEQMETSPFLTLPASWDEYLSSLTKKQRHELKRKIHRLENQTQFAITKANPTQNAFEKFITLHKLSDPNKAKFMTSNMETFFWELLTCEKKDYETQLYVLVIQETQAAMVMVFENSQQILFYNSGFDPAFGSLSAGLLIKALLIKKSIEDKKQIYDMLRGNERYKYDLGSKDMLLFSVIF